MATLTVELSGPIPLSGITSGVEALLVDIAKSVHGFLIHKAQVHLHTTADDYLAGLQPIDHRLLPTGPVATITLVGWLPNAVENGWPGGDMKEALLTGPNARVGKDGVRFNTVPFRHGTPGTSGANFPAMGSAYGPRPALSRRIQGPLNEQEAKSLGKAVHNAMRRIDAKRRKAGLGPGRLPPARAPSDPAYRKKLAAHHKTDIYAGMRRTTKKYVTATGPKYMTFRRVSDNSDPAAFIHPGIEPRHFFKEAQAFAPKVTNKLISGFLKGLESR